MRFPKRKKKENLSARLIKTKPFYKKVKEEIKQFLNINKNKPLSQIKSLHQAV
jgi:hypothetical protein